MKENILTVAELTARVKSLVEANFQNLYIEGEVSNFKAHTSGHLYFTLKDDSAQIQVVMFKSSALKLKFDIEDGMKIILFGRLSVYEKRGNYQFYAERAELLGIGTLQLEFEKLKEKLNKEGLFKEELKKDIPRFPRVIGVVTSPTGAAIRDILNVIGRRFCSVRIILYPAKVQGDGASLDVADGIKALNGIGICDVIIVGRGGGSLEDLWTFNEEIVARAIYESTIPVISAVGHEIDFTISDFVADLRAPTPSAAAELVVAEKENIEEFIRVSRERLISAVRGIISSAAESVDRFSKSYFFLHPEAIFSQRMQYLDELSKRLELNIVNLIGKKRDNFNVLLKELNALSPLAVLSRGYGVISNNGKIVRSCSDISIGDTVDVKLSDGFFAADVKKVLKE